MSVNKIKGTLNTVLEIDLTSGVWSRLEISWTRRKKYLGGKGLAIRLLYDRLQRNIDPFDEKNHIVLMTGVLAGTASPCSGRFHAVFKSPLTGIIGSSSCGGSFGRMLKSSGWDGLIIKGRAKQPVSIHICNDTFEIMDAGSLWTKDIGVVQKRVCHQRNESLIIGPAGENRVLYANVASGGRYLGRGGLGAVMGSKNLKAIVSVKGNYKVVPKDGAMFKKLNARANKYINQNKITMLMRQYGTAANAKPIIENNMLPVHNFQYGNHPKSEQITGEYIRKNHDTSHHTCRPCSIFCGHKGKFNHGQSNVPEYETLALMGASTGIFDPDQISALNDLCNQKGMDTISTGSTLAWAMEAVQNGLIDADIAFGNYEKIVEAVYLIADVRGFGKELAKGTRQLSEKYGGTEFAIQVKGLEMAGYDPRGAWGQGLGYAVANRGACHLSSYPVAFENLMALLNPHTTRAKARFVKFSENIQAAINSMDACQFTGYGMIMETPLTRITPHWILAFLMQNLTSVALFLVDYSLYSNLFAAVTGIELKPKEFFEAGERIHILERLMNTNEGVSVKDDTLPERLLFESQKDDPKKRKVPLKPMLEKYYKLRGYDKNGIPGSRVLKRLGISV